MHAELPNKSAVDVLSIASVTIIWKDHPNEEEEEQLGVSPKSPQRQTTTAALRIPCHALCTATPLTMTKPMLTKPSDEWRGSTDCVRKVS